MLEHFLETPRKKKKKKKIDFSDLQIRPAGRLPRFPTKVLQERQLKPIFSRYPEKQIYGRLPRGESP